MQRAYILDKLIELQERIERLRRDQIIHEKAVADTRSLLSKADEKRRNNPHDRRRWNETIDTLENTLVVSKSTLTRVTAQLNELEKRASDAATTENEQGAPTDSPRTNSELTLANSHTTVGGDVRVSRSPLTPFGTHSVSNEKMKKQIESIRQRLVRCESDTLDSLELGEIAQMLQDIDQLEPSAREICIGDDAQRQLATLRQLLRTSLARLESILQEEGDG